MWVIHGNVSQSENGAPSTVRTRWIAPNTTLQAGRSSKNKGVVDIVFSSKTTSRDHACLSAGPVEAQREVEDSDTAPKVTYKLIVSNRAHNTPFEITRGDNVVQIGLGTEQEVQDGDAILFGKASETIVFSWRPIVVCYPVPAKASKIGAWEQKYDARKAELARIGGLICSTRRPPPIVTIFINASADTLNVNAPLLFALARNLAIVTEKWLDRLNEVTRKNEGARFSSLELDYGHWPQAMGYFPTKIPAPLPELGLSAEPARWQPSPTRSQIFADVALFALPGALIRTNQSYYQEFSRAFDAAGGSMLEVDGENEEALVKAITDKCTARHKRIYIGTDEKEVEFGVRIGRRVCALGLVLAPLGIVASFYFNEVTCQTVINPSEWAQARAPAQRSVHALGQQSSGTEPVFPPTGNTSAPTQDTVYPPTNPTGAASHSSSPSSSLGPTPAQPTVEPDRHDERPAPTEADPTLASSSIPPTATGLTWRKRDRARVDIYDELWSEPTPVLPDSVMHTARTGELPPSLLATSQVTSKRSRTQTDIFASMYAEDAEGSAAQSASSSRKRARTGTGPAQPSPAEDMDVDGTVSHRRSVANGLSEGAAGENEAPPRQGRKVTKMAVRAQEKAQKEAKLAAERQKNETFLQINAKKTRKADKEEQEINKEFNDLKITRDMIMRQPNLPKGYAVGWNDPDLDENLHEELRQYQGQDAADCIFQLRVLPESAYRVRPDRPDTTPPAPILDPRWIGRPNFKAFRPKKLQQHVARLQREDVPLVAHKADDWGLQDSPVRTGKQSTLFRAASDDDEMSKLPDFSSGSTHRKSSGSKSRGKAKAIMADDASGEEMPRKQPGKNAAKRKQVVLPAVDSDEVDGPPASRVRTRGGVPVKRQREIDSDSDEDLVFAGFDAPPKKRAR